MAMADLLKKKKASTCRRVLLCALVFPELTLIIIYYCMDEHKVGD